MLRVLASVGIFAEDEQGRVTLTPSAGLLQTDVPGSMRAWAIIVGDLWWQPWAELLYSVKTGHPAFDHVYGMGQFEYLARNPGIAEIFHATMASVTTPEAPAVISAYDFSEIRTIVDVGGGNGALIAAILKATPSMRGVLFDLPSVIEEARSVIEAEGVAERCELVAGDFFNSPLPSGGDAYILKWILHDWDDERATIILRNCREALRDVERGRLLLVEPIVPPGNELHMSKLADIQMLVMTGGRERTREEFQQLLGQSGFRMTAVVLTQSFVSVVEAIPQ